MADLPVLDISTLRQDRSGLAADRFIATLRDVLHHVGFAHVVGHGIDPDLEENLKLQARAFFALPPAEREALAIGNSAAFRGYTILGDEQTAGARDWRHQLDFGPEQEAPRTNRPAYLRLRGPNQWPAGLPGLAPVALAWLEATLELGLDIMRAIARGLGLPADHFDGFFLPNHDLHAKLIHYPAVDGVEHQGVGRHHDSGLLTFILQDEVPGLQVEIDGEMKTIKPMPGAYVMSLGAMLQSATSGYLRATPHRVLSPRDGRDRLSAALFFNPSFESEFGPLPLPADLESSARPDMVDLKGEAIHTVFGENNLKVRLRSHPDVAAMHYADVLDEVRR